MKIDPTILALVRLGQLTLSSILGFACVYLGYRLFLQIDPGIKDDGKMKFPSLGEITFKAGPGLFFALFGAFIIYESIVKVLTIGDNMQILLFDPFTAL